MTRTYRMGTWEIKLGIDDLKIYKMHQKRLYRRKPEKMNDGCLASWLDF